jgi:hypothetical protein
LSIIIFKKGKGKRKKEKGKRKKEKGKGETPDILFF